MDESFEFFNPTICIPLAMDEIVHLKYFQEIHNTRNYPCSEAEITFMILDLLPSNVPNATFCQSRRSAHPNEAPNNETIVECICLFIVGTTEIPKRSSLHCLRSRASVAHTHTRTRTLAQPHCVLLCGLFAHATSTQDDFTRDTFSTFLNRFLQNSCISRCGESYSCSAKQIYSVLLWWRSGQHLNFDGAWVRAR